MAPRAGAIAFPYRRINVIGTSASGKTTFARRLADRLAVPRVELDALHWGPNWSEASDELMRARVAAATTGPAWIVDGNYAVVRDIVWGRAEAVIWLDFTLPRVLWRYLTRTRRRIRSGEEIWPGTGNRERWSMHLLRRDGLLWWILTTYPRRRREYPLLLARHPRLHAVRLRSPRVAEAWLQAIRPEPD